MFDLFFTDLTSIALSKDKIKDELYLNFFSVEFTSNIFAYPSFTA